MTDLLDVRDLRVEFRQPGWRRPPFVAVDGVSFAVAAGETVGLVGESGSGKSTIGRAVLGLTPASGGTITFDGRDITRAGAGTPDRHGLASELQVVFQDPYGSLDPLLTIGRTLAEPIRAQGRVPGHEVPGRVAGLLRRVSLPARAAESLPSQFSGGQRQRIAIARALGVEPRLIVCDEPISSLDLSTQAQVLNLLVELQREHGYAYLFIAHDLVAVRHLSRRVVVLYRGRIMESGPSGEVCDRPLHPYSRALWAAAPVADPVEQATRRAARTSSVRTGSGGSTVPDAGCPFTPRCPLAADVCSTTRPREVGFAGRQLACHLYDPESGHPRGADHRASINAAAPGRPIEEEGAT